ncbi:phosphatidate cytidylyltransferase [Deinococcus sp.]|uniref:phosphatidate cytidylyltransferase n=1 Tax=Deinococcus sp. TaxID=47478 RepID=UPI0025EFB594|nr:phosphatidate cytidylyltransferase [Deinococcus sp.]
MTTILGTLQGGVGIVLSFILALLVLATIISEVLPRVQGRPGNAELIARVRAWWVMAGLFVLAVLVDKRVGITFVMFLSYLALKEYLSLIPQRRSDRRVLLWVYLAIPLQYLWVYTGRYGMFIIVVPVYVFLFLPFRLMLTGVTQNFLRASSTLHWGLMLTVFALGHLAYLLVLPPLHPAGGVGLLLYVVLVTQFGDVAQYVCGKRFGRRKIVPQVSPNKTWEGFLGGLVSAALLAVLIAPVITPLNRLEALVLGLALPIVGFIGDVTMSAVKRDLGVKDASSLIPGHGGILDRIDSLMFTAPVFFHFIYYFVYGPVRG